MHDKYLVADADIVLHKIFENALVKILDKDEAQLNAAEKVATFYLTVSAETGLVATDTTNMSY